VSASQDRAAMAEAVNRLSDSVDVMEGIRNNLDSYKQEALGTWKGNAAQTFGRVMARFDEELRTIIQAENDLMEKMGAARRTYEQTEAEQEQSVSSIEGLLNH